MLAFLLSGFAFLLVGSAWLLSALEAPVKPVEVERIKNPNLSIEAVMATRDAGATTSTVYEVYLVPVGCSLSGEAVFRADHVYEGIELLWASDTELTIVVDKARLFFHRPIVVVPISTSHTPRVVTTLRIRALDTS